MKIYLLVRDTYDKYINAEDEVLAASLDRDKVEKERIKQCKLDMMLDYFLFEDLSQLWKREMRIRNFEALFHSGYYANTLVTFIILEKELLP